MCPIRTIVIIARLMIIQSTNKRSSAPCLYVSQNSLQMQRPSHKFLRRCFVQPACISSVYMYVQNVLAVCSKVISYISIRSCNNTTKVDHTKETK